MLWAYYECNNIEWPIEYTITYFKQCGTLYARELVLHQFLHWTLRRHMVGFHFEI